MENTNDDYPYRATTAAKMLAGAIRRRQSEGLSLRKLAPTMGYKQATVLSHMANGRIPVPIAKATDIAKGFGLPPSEFLLAVMDQREPEAHTLLAATAVRSDLLPRFAEELEEVAGRKLDELNTEQKDVMRRVVLDPRPQRRWLSEAEIPIMQLLRRLRPEIEQAGLSFPDRSLMMKALESNRD